MRSALAILISIFLLSGQGRAAEGTTLKNDKDKLSYTMGVDIGKHLRQQSMDVDPDMFAEGLKDVMTGAKTALTDEEMQQIISNFQKETAEKQAVKMKAVAEKNKREGEAFLAENKKKEGVKILANGLQYKVIKDGKGQTPKLTDTVTTNYRGTLIDGTEFDSSYKRGQPAKFPVGGVILGWREALQLMKVGSKWQIFIPSNLAYGEMGAGNVIGANQTLIFEIELISIN
ncbi:MAG: FKBP-type peptidyl-prolyl cis-trans isomerase [Syntrophales bacterium]|jgi:FKBP-type peptidyl-prolyl cis-trans isomerase FklB